MEQRIYPSVDGEGGHGIGLFEGELMGTIWLFSWRKLQQNIGCTTH